MDEDTRERWCQCGDALEGFVETVCDMCRMAGRSVRVEEIAGIDPDFTGKLTATEYINRLRGG